VSIVLVVNSGSSSMKYQLIDVEAAEPLASGLIERIGQADGRATHTVRHPSTASSGGADAGRGPASIQKA
jgi:acetate kinase